MTEEASLSNDILKQVFQDQHEIVLDHVNTTAVIDRLFSAKVIGISDLHDLDLIPHRTAKCRRLLILLHKSKNPEAFVQLRLAISHEPADRWIVDEVDRLYAAASETAPQTSLAAAAAAAAAVSSSQGNVKPVTERRDSTTAELLRKEVETLKRENARLKEEIQRLKRRETELEAFLADYAKRLEQMSRIEKERDEMRRIIAELKRDSVIWRKNNLMHSNQLQQVCSAGQLQSSSVDDVARQVFLSVETDQEQPFFARGTGLPVTGMEKHAFNEKPCHHQSVSRLQASPALPAAHHFLVGGRQIQFVSEPWDEDSLMQHELLVEATRPTDAVGRDLPHALVDNLERKTAMKSASRSVQFSLDDDDETSEPDNTPPTGKRGRPITSAAATLMSNVVAKGNSVRGVTSFGSQLYVVRWPSSQQVEVYDSVTFVLLRPLLVPGLKGIPQGLTSCFINTCLYVGDCSNHVVFRIELRGDANVVKNWRVNGSPRGLSVNDNGHVIVAVRSDGDVDRILEITTHGSLIREIRLQPDVVKIWHAVQLTGDRFVVCHGEHSDRRRGDVCIVQVRTGANELKPADGLVTSRFGKNSGVATTQLAVPMHAAAQRNGCVFVADRFNNRLLTMDRSLRGARVIPVTVDGGLQGPCALFLDESLGRLYVGEWNGGRVLVFDDVELLSLQAQTS